MVALPLNITTDINITVHCSYCHKQIEATYIVSPEQNTIMISVDFTHDCFGYKLPVTKSIKESMDDKIQG